ncbi:MAG: chemotaxis protein CheB [Desulfobacterales bacterium]|nr:chemotaxis protein CheB [Desulfobacterales bacterium]
MLETGNRKQESFKAVVIGTSAGGLTALTGLLPVLSADFPLPVIIVLHLHKEQRMGFMIGRYNKQCALTVKTADEKEIIQPGYIYFAPPDYHLLVEQDQTFSLSVDEKVNYSRPSIDVLFESAADVYCPALIGVILTGASNDGAKGLKAIKQNGGMAIIQNPYDAELSYMPRAAMKAVRNADYILSLKEIGELFQKWEVGSEKWEVRSGKWEVRSEKWEVGSGK